MTAAVANGGEAELARKKRLLEEQIADARQAQAERSQDIAASAVASAKKPRKSSKKKASDAADGSTSTAAAAEPSSASIAGSVAVGISAVSASAPTQLPVDKGQVGTLRRSLGCAV
jgi:hypothetical protein